MAKKTAAKKPEVKKPRRRLKRTARRSLAAVLMITAVVVAAIPVPENVAAPEGGIAALADAPEDVHESKGYLNGAGAGSATDATQDPYGYDASKVKDVPLPTGIALDTYEDYDVDQLVGALGNGVEAAYGITDLGNGTYSLGWQFMYYVVNNPRSGQEAGAICKYNREFYTPTVDLSLFPTTKYFTVEPTDFDNYFVYYIDGDPVNGVISNIAKMMDNTDPTNPLKYTYTQYKNGNQPDEENLKFFNTYFKEAYDAKVAEFAAYKRLEDAVAANPNAPDPGPAPADFVRTPSVDLSLDQKLQYFCEHNNQLKRAGENFKLFAVRDNRPGRTGSGIVYLAKGGTLPTGSNYSKDKDDFLILETTEISMCAIANRAFQDVTNVEQMNIPGQIGYIGDEAFLGASMLNSITLNNVDVVGNRAFQGCLNLSTVDLGQTTKTIGVECFRGTKITSVKFSNNIATIGYGAFSNCRNLETVTFEDGGADCEIGNYAFYNCTSLKDVSMTKTNIRRIGDGAFAVEGGAQPMHFVLPEPINASDGLGDYLFVGRSSLEYVVFPRNYGRDRGSAATIPPAMFHGCTNLQYVSFPCDQQNDPQACGYVDYNPDILFADVINRDFYVEGPKLNSSGQPALPRTSTWDATTAVSGVVPYLYHENGKNYWEVSNGFYLFCIDNEGTLTSCTLKPGADVTNWNGVLDIPATVGNTSVKAIGDNCFTDSELNEAVVSIRIPDNSIETIAGGVFRGGTGDNNLDWLKLKDVYIGNSVKAIGASAFEGCTALNDIFLNSPTVAHSEFSLGADAFKTESNGLTIHGDIATDYDPYEWAMSEAAYVRSDGVRACYKSLVPSYLTVIRDDNTKLATLVDYPKFQDVSKILDEAYKFDIMAGPDGTFENPYKNYKDMRVAQSYASWSGDDGNGRREAFKSAWMQATTDEAREAVYASDNYGPWVNPTFVAEAGTWGTAVTPPSGGGVTSGGSTTDPDNPDTDTNAMNKIADFFFEPIVAYAAALPQAYYDRVGYEIGVTDPTNDELALLNAVRNIEIPDGVNSIDVYSYFYGVKGDNGRRTGRENNQKSAGIYFGSSKQGDSWYMYTSSAEQEENDPTDVVPGLFSGYYDDKLDSDDGEQFKRGNDLIQSVTMNSVQYLPDYAFDSCENLLSVNLGPACSDIGIAPFRGCYEMETVGDNEWYTTTNGIIYSKNTDGSLTIEECLSARGRKTSVGPAIVSALNEGDSNIKSVSAIKPGAFEDCDDLTRVLFGSNDTAGLKEIPEDCFKNCDRLLEVVLPITVNDIGRGAFVGAKNLSDLTVYGDEVKISGSAFDEDKVETMVRAHEDSAVARYVKEYGSQYKLVMDEANPLGRQWKVSFYDANYELIEDLEDDLGNPIENPQYVEDGELAEFPADPTMDGWTFESWIGLNGATQRTPIREDTIFYAQGHFDSGAPVDGKWMVEFLDGVDGTRIADYHANSDGKYYIEAGTSFADHEWAEPLHPTHAGFEPAGFTSGYNSGNGNGAWTAQTKIDRNMTIIALYKPSDSGSGTTSGGSTNTSGGTTNTSGGTTNTSGNTTSSSRTSSSSSSSSSTSSSSTSTTSTTSGEGMYTVFVENGYGSGSYAPGTMVIVTAAQPAAGMRFDRWTTESNGVTLVSVSLPATTFQMPSNNVSIKANFVADTTPQAANTVGGGSGGNTNNGTNDNGNTRVDIQKPGISNRDLATANVNGSTDNFVVKISETDEATRAVAAALTNKYGTLDNILYYAMDISLYDSTGTTKITDTTGLSVDITIPIPDSLVAYGGNNMAGAVINGDQLESLNENFTTINGVPCIRFRATHFSPYTIYVDTGNLVEGMLDTTPKTGDPIHPKWFLSLGLACLSIILFMKKDRRATVKVKKKS